MSGRGGAATALKEDYFGPEDVIMLRECFLMGMSRAKFAALIGVCEMTVVRWERPEGHADSTLPEPHNVARMQILMDELVASPMVPLPEVLAGRAAQQYVDEVERKTAQAVERYQRRVGMIA